MSSQIETTRSSEVHEESSEQKEDSAASNIKTWTPERRQEYMKAYMCGYRRAHPGLSTPYVRKFRANQRKAASSEAGAVATQRQDDPEERS